jgi:hypothetical protein
MKTEELSYEYSNKQVTAFGGMLVVKKFLDKTGIKNYLSSDPHLPASRSNAGYNPVHLLEAFWVSVFVGANRFSHTAILRLDKTLAEIFGWKRCPSDNTYERFFRKFDLESSTNFFNGLQHWFFDQIKVSTLTLDVDSSVWTRYGKQQGAAVGYNSKKKGRPSHHPLIGFIPELKMVANFWLRPGNTSSSNNVLEFLEETFRMLRGKTVGLFRADSGFYSKAVMDWLEEKHTDYVISVKMYPYLKQSIREIKNWLVLDKGIWISEIQYQSPLWDKPRRIVVIRQSIDERPTATGKLLFAEEELYKGHRYHAIVTSLKLSAKDIWDLYKKRADAENRIKELEYDFGSDNFCMNDFYATEMALRMVMVSYNLMALYKITILQSEVSQRLSTIRFNCFSIGSWVVKNGNKRVLKMSVAMEKRKWMDGLFLKSSNFSWDTVKSY